MKWKERKGKLMSVQCKSKRRFVTAGVLFLIIFLCMPVKLLLNGEGIRTVLIRIIRRSAPEKTWIGDYYVNAKGVRQTGWLKKGGKRYYFRKTVKY